MKFCEFFSKCKEQNENMNIFVLSSSPGMGKSVFGIIFVLFIANAISISNPNNQEIDKNKYSDFFPELALNPSEETKGYVIVFYHKTARVECLVVQFDFSTNVWECIYEGEVYPFSRSFPGYKYFFILDSTTFINIINFSCFDGVIILIGSPKSVMPLTDLNKPSIGNYDCFYFPLWEDFEFEIFLNHFHFPNSFEILKINNDLDIISRMGLEDLKKTEVFGNNPRILSRTSAYDVKFCLNFLTTALRNRTFTDCVRRLSLGDLEDENIDYAIHQMFFMKPTDNYKDFRIVPASNYILCLINRYINYMNIQQASINYHNSINNHALQEINFQTYFHTYIFERMKNCVINLTSKYVFDGKNFQPQEFRKITYTFTVSKYNEVANIVPSGLVDGGFYCPEVFNFPTFDSVFRGTVHTRNKNKKVVFFFQCTIRKDHDIKEEGYLIIKNCLNLLKPKEVSLIFIVPDAQEPFTPYLDSSLKEFNCNITVYLGSFPML
jgi:hypothetical protein